MSDIVKEPEVAETKNCDTESGEEPEHDPHYDPIISLPEVKVSTHEEDEIVMLNVRAKLYRYDSNEVPPEWKERGTGNVKILRHKLNDTFRVVMRRDKTLKLCANHFITPYMNLKPNSSCERAWVYSAKDFSDSTVKSELLAIKFANIKDAMEWKDVFEEAKKVVAKHGRFDNKKDAVPEDKVISIDSLKLNDTFEETVNSEKEKEKEKEKEEDKVEEKEKEKENENKTETNNETDSASKNQTNLEVTEKLSSMNIKEGVEES